MSQIDNVQKTASDFLPGQTSAILAKFYYCELDGKIVPLYTKDDFIVAGLSCLGDAELEPSHTRTMQELIYPPRHIKKEEASSLADIPHQASVTPAVSRTSVTATPRVEHRTYQPTTMGSLGVKKYCTHWLRTGECDFNQQGCLFEHVIPDEETLFGTLGFKTIPRWIRESGRELPFAPHNSAPPTPTPAPIAERAYVPPSGPSGPPPMYMGRPGNFGRPLGPPAPPSAPRFSTPFRSGVGPTTKPYPAGGYQGPRPAPYGGGRPNSYRPIYGRSHIPPYSPVHPHSPYSGRGDGAGIDRSKAPSPAMSDYSIASNNSYVHWQPSLPPRPGSGLSYNTNLTTNGFSNHSSPQTPSSSIFVPGNSSIYGTPNTLMMPHAPVPHIEHRKMFAGKIENGDAKNKKPGEKEEGEVSEDKGEVMKYD